MPNKLSTKNILLGWMGFSDTKAFSANAPDVEGYGPIATTLRWEKFDKAFILFNAQMKDISIDYKSWLQTLYPYTEIKMVKTDVPDPTEYASIYQAAIKAAHNAYKNGDSLTFQTSAGTSHMGVVWLMLQKRFNARLVKSSKEHGVSEITFPFNLSAELIEKGSSVEPNEEGSLIYKSSVMSLLMHQIDNAAPLSRPVLIEGESGTGKELIATRLHKSRAVPPPLSGKFISLNCGALPREIIESELFGHVKGAFTGAVDTKKGKIESAHNGTLFLDEIGELPLDQQVKLLRVLQEKEVIKLGDDSGKPTKVNFRLVAATNKNLMKEVSKGNFREDLYYRIAVICLKVPPLRQRGAEDINLIAQHHIDKMNLEFEKLKLTGYSTKVLTEPAKEILIGYKWPGNIRELSTILYRAAIWNPESEEITADDINRAFDGQESLQNTTNDILNRLDIENSIDLESIIDEVRRHYMEKALEKCSGVVNAAKEMLGVKSRMDYQLQRLGIDPQSFK